MDAQRWRRVHAVVEAVLAADEGRRAGVLDQECASDADLRREVESLLAEQGQAARLLEAPAWQDAAEALVSEEVNPGASGRPGEAGSAHPILEPGTRLGPYEIQSAIGAGGMGEVYQGRDTRLGRTVAIKVLPPDLAGDPERRRRFEHEARAVSALNHPHICTLHDIGDAVPACPACPERAGERASRRESRREPSSVSYLVLEYIDGHTLAERLAAGPLPVAHVFEIGAQIAEALSAAHRQGIVHRDLKPGNVMLTKASAPTASGVHVKLLDFGLAKLRAHGEQPLLTSPAAGPSASASLTMRGEILGTWPYMAPEQVEGKPADARTDIWALGAVLYEMLTGAPAFAGETPTNVAAAILEHEPAAVGALRPGVLPPLDRLVRKCLAKDPDRRWHAAADLADELRWQQSSAAEDARAARASRERRWSGSPAVWVIGALLVGIAAVAVLAWALSRSGGSHLFPRHAQITTQPAEGLRGPDATGAYGLNRPSQTAIALSPDGRTLVFTGLQQGRQQLYRRKLSEDVAVPFDDSEGAEAPFFSPDGAWVGYWARGAIWRVAVEGGIPIRLFSSDIIRGASWGQRQMIATAPLGSIVVTPAGGGQSRVIIEAGESEDYSHPHFLPDGNTLLFTIRKRRLDASIAAISLTSGVRTALVDGAMDARYLPTGHLLYSRLGKAEAVPFDVRRLAIVGEPEVVLSDVMQFVNSGSALDTGSTQLTCSAEGTLVYVPGGMIPDRPSQLVWLDRTGATVDTLPIPDAPYSAPRLSPDGQRIAYARTGLSQSLWQYDLVRQVPTRILIHEPEAWQPMWSADGRRLLYSDERRLFTVPVDGATSSVAVPGGESEAAIVREYPGPALPGRDAFLISRSERGVYSVWLLELSEGRAVRTPVLKLTDPADESGRLSGITYPAVSPDGRWLAYASTESGPFAVHVCRFPSMRDKQRLSSTSGRAPVWRRDGRELFYLRTSPQAALMALTVNPDTGSFGPPHILFTLPEGLHSGTFAVPAYDAAPDGQRFLFVRRHTEPIPPPPSEMRVVFNWFEELKAKVPTGRR